MAWDDPVESKQATILLEDWACIGVDDALELLNEEFTHPLVREYAVKQLAVADDAVTLHHFCGAIMVFLGINPLSFTTGTSVAIREFRSKRETGCSRKIGSIPGFKNISGITLRFELGSPVDYNGKCRS